MKEIKEIENKLKIKFEEKKSAERRHEKIVQELKDNYKNSGITTGELNYQEIETFKKRQTELNKEKDDLIKYINRLLKSIEDLENKLRLSKMYSND